VINFNADEQDLVASRLFVRYRVTCIDSDSDNSKIFVIV
jgi:hypothetical protein